MTASERADLRERLVSYMEYHPLSVGAKTKMEHPVMVSEPFRVISSKYISSFIGVFAMVVLIIVPVVAERAVPGDMLYPVKVSFNEEVRSGLAFSPYAKVEWETKRLERRLAEARLLADEGKLTEEVEAEVAQAVQAHSDAAKQEIEVIRANDSDEAAIAEIAFASALEVQSEVLENRAEKENSAGNSTAALAGVVAEARNGVEASQETSNPSFEKLLARIEMETTTAGELFASVQESASPEEVADINRRFEDIKRKIDEAIGLYAESMDTASTSAGNSGLDQESKQLLKTALTDTRKLISFMTDIDVRTNVTIEELVPLTLTTEEKQVIIDSRVAALLSLQERVNSLQPGDDMAEKFAYGKDNFDSLVQEVLEKQTTGDFKEIIEILNEAELTANDLLLIGTMKDVVVPEPDIDTASSSATTTEESAIEDGTDLVE